MHLTESVAHVIVSVRGGVDQRQGRVALVGRATQVPRPLEPIDDHRDRGGRDTQIRRQITRSRAVPGLTQQEAQGEQLVLPHRHLITGASAHRPLCGTVQSQRFEHLASTLALSRRRLVVPESSAFTTARTDTDVLVPGQVLHPTRARKRRHTQPHKS